MSPETAGLMNQAIMERHSTHAFSNLPIEKAKVTALLEAARWAPSSRNNQPWRLIMVTDPQVLASLKPALARGNQWAFDAPLIIVMTADPDSDDIIDGKPYYLFDCGIATENLLLQAFSMGLQAHPLAGWSESAVKEALSIPESMRVVIVIVVGYKGKIETLDEYTQQKEVHPVVRKPLSEIVYRNRWGQKMP